MRFVVRRNTKTSRKKIIVSVGLL